MAPASSDEKHKITRTILIISRVDIKKIPASNFDITQCVRVCVCAMELLRLISAVQLLVAVVIVVVVDFVLL